MAFALVFGLSSQGGCSKLEGQAGYAQVREERELLGLIKLMQGISYKFEKGTKPLWALHQAKKRLSLFWQEKGVSIEKY